MLISNDIRKKIDQILAGAYSPEVIKRWRIRSRIALNNKTPKEVFETDPKKVLAVVLSINT